MTAADTSQATSKYSVLRTPRPTNVVTGQWTLDSGRQPVESWNFPVPSRNSVGGPTGDQTVECQATGPDPVHFWQVQKCAFAKVKDGVEVLGGGCSLCLNLGVATVYQQLDKPGDWDH